MNDFLNSEPAPQHSDLDSLPWLEPVQNVEEKSLGPIENDPVYNAMAAHLKKKKRKKSFVTDIGIEL